MSQQRIKSNVGGTIFETTSTTLSKSGFITTYLNNWNFIQQDIVFIDRDPTAFSHALAFMRDSNHRVPMEYKYELEYLAVDYLPENLSRGVGELEERKIGVEEERLTLQKREQRVCIQSGCFKTAHHSSEHPNKRYLKCWDHGKYTNADW